MHELREILSVRLKDHQLVPAFLDDQERLVESCQGLVVFDEGSGILRFTHYTVQEFLQEHCRKLLLSEVDLAKLCLTFLTFRVFEKPCMDEDSIVRRLETHRFTGYAIRFWGSYTRGAGEDDPDILEMLLTILKSSERRAALRQLELFEEFGDRWRRDNMLLLQNWTMSHVIAWHGLA